MRILIFFYFFFLAISFLSGDDVINDMCPVMPEEMIDPDYFVEYQGKKIYLCCRQCIRKFNKNPESYISDLPQFSPSLNVSKKEKKEEEIGKEVLLTEQSLSFFQRLYRFIGKLHPFAIHFPIALLLAAAFAELLVWRSKNVLFFQNAALFSISLAALGAVAAVFCGWAAGAFSNYPSDYQQVLFFHRWLGVGATLLMIVSAIFCQKWHRSKKLLDQKIYRVTLIFSFLLMSTGGHLGAVLVYGWDHYLW